MIATLFNLLIKHLYTEHVEYAIEIGLAGLFFKCVPLNINNV